MMDGAHLFVQGFHPQRQDRKSDFKPTAPYYTRTRLAVKYYLIDFGLSRRYDPANGPPWEDIRGGDKSPPGHMHATPSQSIYISSGISSTGIFSMRTFCSDIGYLHSI
jgi:hypothetical protein